MKVLIGANVWLSAFVLGGVCRKMIRLAAARSEFVSNDAIAGEVAKKLLLRFRLEPDDAREVLTEMHEMAERVEQPAFVPAVCRDRDDDVHLATALAADCSILITGGTDLLVPDPDEGLRILNPREFLDILENSTR